MIKGESLIFFDFEFAGIDDPSKLIADLLLQPDYSIPNQYIYLMNSLVNELKTDIPFFKKRLEIIFDLYRIKWFCIIFNPLIKKDSKYLKKTEINFLLEKARNYFLNFEKKKELILEIIF